MSLRLILTRHAKSCWSDPSMEDHARPLNRRGETSAAAIGKWLTARGYVPEVALVSSSERTKQTWELVSQAFDAPPQARFLDALFHAEPDVLMDHLRRAGAGCVMLIAHNPGIAFLARGLVRQLPEDARFERYPTAATAVIDFRAEDWGKVGWNSGEVTDLAFARDLI
ncbi:MAG: phosphoglycerate mutase [Rhodobacterales bacterium]|nr:MAG: phosphoglycerate mutase [Rhodobacterales bacterium]